MGDGSWKNYIQRIEANGEDYFQMIQNIKDEREDIKFIGHSCLKLNQCHSQIIGCRINSTVIQYGLANKI